MKRPHIRSSRDKLRFPPRCGEIRQRSGTWEHAPPRPKFCFPVQQLPDAPGWGPPTTGREWHSPVRAAPARRAASVQSCTDNAATTRIHSSRPAGQVQSAPCGCASPIGRVGARPPGRLGLRGVKSTAPCGHVQRPASQGMPAADPRSARPEHHRGRQGASNQNHQHGAGRGKVARSGPCCFKHIADYLAIDQHTKAALEMTCRRSDQELRIFTAAPARKAPASALSGRGSQHPAGAGAKYRDQPALEPDIQHRHDIGRDQQVQPKMRDPRAHPAQPLEVCLSFAFCGGAAAPVSGRR